MNSSPWLHSRAVPAICPKCTTPALLRSHAQSRFEQKRKQVTGKRPWRCHNCGWRGWFEEAALQYPANAKSPLPPEIAGADVPIPDLELESYSHSSGVPGSRKDRFLKEDARSESELNTVSAKAGKSGHATRSRANDKSRRSYAVFGIAVSEHAPETEKEALTSIDPEETINVKPAIAEPDGGHSAAPVANELSEADTSSVETAAKLAAKPAAEPVNMHQSRDMTVAPPEFGDQSGRPVSVTVTTAFHHEARNKSWSCPKCNESALYRSRTRTMGEMFKKQFIKKRPYRCHRCGWRGWLTR
jgi:predicted RNA-binding Zn-ribbon protein involved in translation (DUF1610 family)